MSSPISPGIAETTHDIGARDLAPPEPAALLHGVTLRPPQACWDGRSYAGPRLLGLDQQAARNVPGVEAIIVKNNFVGIVASQASQARHALNLLDAQWSAPAFAAGSDTAPPIAAKAGSGAPTLHSSYTWQAPADDEQAAWAIASYQGRTVDVWTSCPRSDALRSEIAALCNLPVDSVAIHANGQRQTDGFDIAVDAALLSRGVARPVHVRRNAFAAAGEAVEIAWSASLQAGNEIKTASGDRSSAMAASLAQCSVDCNQYVQRRPSIAALLCGYACSYEPDTAIPASYSAQPPLLHVTAPNAGLDATTGLHYAAAHIFARESFFDELCRSHLQDPVSARLDTVRDSTGRRLIESVSARAGWDTAAPTKPNGRSGKGFAYSHVIDNTREPPRQVWSAWVAEVGIDASGSFGVTRLTVGHDAENLGSPTGSTRQIEGTIRDMAQRLLPASIRHGGQENAQPGESAPGHALALPRVDLVHPDRTLPAALDWSSHAELPAAAAIANAIYDATGLRLRQAPFDSGLLEQIHARKPMRAERKIAYALLGGLASAAAGLVLGAMPWRTAIAPAGNVDTSIYSRAAIERGRLVAAAGDCMVCHTAQGGIGNAGGRALETPFGVVYSTNITPDRKTGIGTWSYAAFERAMRQGIGRDGRHLYPAFPYTAFSKISDADMQSLYGYLMSQPPVESTVPKTQLAFPYNMRPLMAGWNLLFHRNAKPYQPVAEQSTLWNRGAYLVNSMGHCGACHSPRNALGAEKSGKNNFLSGGFADGWEAPPLNRLSKAPIAWTEEELFNYLRTGYSSLHGVAAGPMTPVVQELAKLPQSDVRAIAHYLGALNPAPASETSAALRAARLEDASKTHVGAMTHPGENLFEGACAVCHDARGGPPLFGSRPSLALNSNLHSDMPDNIIQVLMHGVADPATGELGYMPGFKDSLDDSQIETLLGYLRQRFAPGKPAWTDLPKKISRIRNQNH